MGDVLDHIEAAMGEVTKARAWVVKGKSKQLRAAGELDRLKAVSFAWFKTHRPAITRHHAKLDLSGADAAYHVVLDATAKFAARTTYAAALQDAKRRLVEIRRAVAEAPVIPDQAARQAAGPASPGAPPSFSALAADPSMQAILARRWEEVQRCIASGAPLAATVMMGGLLETLLLARINVAANKASIFTAKGAPRDKAAKTLPLSEWKLVNMVEVAHELKWITRSAKDVGNVLRDFRNYIHPYKEHTDGVLIRSDDAKMFWEVCKAISRQVLGSVGSNP